MSSWTRLASSAQFDATGASTYSDGAMTRMRSKAGLPVVVALQLDANDAIGRRRFGVRHIQQTGQRQCRRVIEPKPGRASAGWMSSWSVAATATSANAGAA